MDIEEFDRRMGHEGFTYLNIEVPPLQFVPDDMYLPPAPLAWRVGLYMVGRDLELKCRPAELDDIPESAKVVGRKVYSECRRKAREPDRYRLWHSDCVVEIPINQTPKGMPQSNYDYSLVRYFKDMEEVDLNHKGKMILKPSSRTTETIIQLPTKSGFIVPTMDGIYHPVTGTPFEVVQEVDIYDAWGELYVTSEKSEIVMKKEDEVHGRWIKAGFRGVNTTDKIPKFKASIYPSDMYIVESESSRYAGEFRIRIMDRLSKTVNRHDMFSADRFEIDFSIFT